MLVGSCTVNICSSLSRSDKGANENCKNEWIKPCTNHLYWSAKTTHDGNGEVIWAKFSSFFSHVVDKHENLDNTVFNKCGHKDTIQPRKWLDKGTVLNSFRASAKVYIACNRLCKTVQRMK